MLIQSLVLVTAMVLLSGAILTATLVNSRAELHHIVLAKTRIALDSATNDFRTAMAGYVAQHGTEQTQWPGTRAVPENVCQEINSGSARACSFVASAAWHVTGASGGRGAAAATSGTSTAQNLAALIDEQRIAATITARVTSLDKKTVFGTRSRLVTARIFNAVPYVVVTAVRDVDSLVGSSTATEGDSGGQYNNAIRLRFNAPDVMAPASYIDTELHATVDCVNSSATVNDDPKAPALYVDPHQRIGGNADWKYETACNPSYANRIDTSEAPPAYVAPTSSIFQTDPSVETSSWEKGDSNSSGFAR